MIGGIDLVVSEHALKDSDVRNFPVSRHRSARVHKKLVKRHGGEFRKVGCVYRMGNKMVIHPTLYAELQREMSNRLKDSTEKMFYQNYSMTENRNVV